MKTAECAIVGSGIAGVAAAIYACRAGLKTMIFEKGMVGGQLMYVGEVDNYPGLPGATQGRQIYETLQGSLAGLELSPLNATIEKVCRENEKICLTDQQGQQYETATLIIASGAAMKKLGLPGEDEFTGKGVSYCAVCDGFFFKDKEVAVAGGGNSAVEEAIYLSGICKKVYLIHRRDSLRALEYLQQELLARSNVEIIWNSRVREIKGDRFLQELTIEDVGDETCRSLAVQGLFVAIGIEPATGFLGGLVNCDENGFIIADEEMRASAPGVFACGDCRRRPLRQLITAAAEGAIAAISAYRFLRGSYISS